MEQVPSYYVALRATDALAEQADKFITCFDDNPMKGQGVEYVELIAHLTEHVCRFFLTEPAALAELGSMHSNIISMCATTSSKVSGMLTSKLFKKKPNRELEHVANYWRSLYRQTSSGEVYIVYPAELAFAQKFNGIVEAARMARQRG